MTDRSGSISSPSVPKYVRPAPDVKTEQKTEQPSVRNLSQGTGQQQDLQIRNLHGKKLQNELRDRPISETARELLETGNSVPIGTRSVKPDWQTRIASALRPVANAVRTVASACGRKFVAALGRLRLEHSQIRSFQLDPSDPVVKMFFKGNLHNDTGAAVFDRIRHLALNGTTDEKQKALRLMMMAADQCDQDKRLSFYEEYYDNFMIDMLARVNKSSFNRSEFSTVDRWIMLSRHGYAAKILGAMEPDHHKLQFASIEILQDLVNSAPRIRK